MLTVDMAGLESRARLDALQRSGLLDTPAEEAFDRLTRLAAAALDCPVALVSLVDDRRQFFKSAAGLDLPQTPLSHSFCQHVVTDEAPLVVSDARTEPRLQGNGAIADLGVIAYCGVPIRDGDGHVLGSFCAIDGEPRTWSERDVRLLTELSGSIGTELALRAANRDLRLREEELQRTFDSAPNGMALVGLDGRWLRVNPVLCELFGRTEDELLGEHYGDITHPEDRALCAALVERVLTGTQGPDRVQKRYLHRSGRPVWVSASLALVRDTAGAPLHFVSQIEDIRQARLAEREVREARRRLEQAEAIAGIGSWEWDLEADAVSWSPEQYRLHGRDPAWAAPPIDAYFATFIHPDDRDAVRAAMESHLQSREPFVDEYRIVHPDGTVRTVRVEGDVLPADPAAGLPARLAGTTHDITGEREAALALSDSEQRHRVLLASLPDTMVVLYDSELRCTLLQGALVDSLGLDRTHYEGRHLSDFLAPADFARLGPLIRRALDGEAHATEYETAAGRTYHVEIAPYLTDDGTATAAFAVWRDITDRLAREREARMLAMLVEQSEDAIIAKDAAGTITEWNRGAEVLYGYTAEEARGRHISIIVPASRAGEDVRLLNRALAGESVAPFATRRRRQDGSIVDVSISVSPVRDAHGEVTGACVIARDVSAQVRGEQAREAAEARLRVTVEHAPIGVALVALGAGRAGRILSANPAFRALVGGGADTLRLQELVHAEDTATIERDLGLLASDACARTDSEVRGRASGGREGWLQLAAAAVPGPGGTPDQAVVHVLDIGERKRLEGRLQHLADHDTLTGLFNRRRLELELAGAVARPDRGGALLLIDLDGFKFVNDTMGHSQGDALVARAAELLRESLRATDVLARLGGDEFAVILPGAGAAEATAVADKLLRVLEAGAIVLTDRRHARVTASIGVTTFTGEDASTAEELMAEADIAMYDAKDRGKNQVAVYRRDHGQREALLVRESLLDQLRTAIAEERFELHAQPIVPLTAADPCERHELLLRLRGEDGQFVPPSAFLPTAERFDLVQQIDRWVIRRALALLRAHHAAGSDVVLTVNMSGKTLGDPRLLEDLGTMLAAQPVPPGRLVVEVTETAAIVNVEKAREVARALRDLGCAFALDDFGAGFASFYYLKHLDFDYLKIDGDFVTGLGRDPADQLVVQAVVDVARGLGVRTIAEHVGDAAAVERLRALGVDYGQGFHLGRPVPVDALLRAAR